jgi:uncharacterized protein
MKNQLIKTIALLGMAISVLLWAPSICLGQYRNNTELPDRPTISVTGDAEINVIPDKVVIVVLANNRDSVLTKAKAKVDKNISSFTAIAKKYGIKTVDIQTDYINVEPDYLRDYTQEKFLGYAIQRRLVITLRNIAMFDSIMSDLINAGATEIEDVQFQTTELRKYRDDARVAAIKAASEKANLLAEQLGVKVCKPYNIQEMTNNLGGWWGWYGWGNRYNRPGALNSSQNAFDQQAGEALPTAVGKISAKASVKVVFELE